MATFKGHSSGVLALDRDSSGSLLLSGSEDGTAIVWDTVSLRILQRFEGHKKATTGVALASPQRAITTSWDDTVILWGVDAGCTLLRLFVDSAIWAIAARGKQVVAGDVGGAVYFFEIREPKQR
jgi:WD40 repeat protein